MTVIIITCLFRTGFEAFVCSQCGERLQERANKSSDSTVQNYYCKKCNTEVTSQQLKQQEATAQRLYDSGRSLVFFSLSRSRCSPIFLFLPLLFFLSSQPRLDNIFLNTLTHF